MYQSPSKRGMQHHLDQDSLPGPPPVDEMEKLEQEMSMEPEQEQDMEH